MKRYLCDQQKECSTHPNCKKNGGECGHTTDKNHALKYQKGILMKILKKEVRI